MKYMKLILCMKEYSNVRVQFCVISCYLGYAEIFSHVIIDTMGIK